jgi:catechol 2,3-dioxygenase-like lactoylglutathione lyase family enzyme
MAVSRLHHVNIRTTDLDATQKFYEDVVGLEVGPRPPFGNPGVWLYAEGHPWVHVSIADAANQGEEGADEGFFNDPNGVQLEFTCALADAEADGLAVPDRQR